MNNASRLMISTFGGFAGLMGIEHGIGEVLQGSKAPDGLVFASWPGSPFFDALGGEPAMSIVPNLLISGMLAILFSLAYTVWAVLLVKRKHSGWVLMALTIPMLLFGAGLFPPVLGLMVGAAATRIHAPLTWWRKHLSGRTRKLLGTLWPWLFGAALLTWLLMFPGVPVMDHFLGFFNENLIMTLLGGMFVFLILAGIAAFARDSQRPARRV